MSQPDPVPYAVGRYVICSEIASGGLGSVHFARLVGPSGFARTVAVKRPHPHLARQREFALMLLDEARLAARIRHPNVVQMVDVIQTSTDLLLVMDYVHGDSLANLAAEAQSKNEKIPLAIAASIIVDILHGLHAAHEATDEQGQPLGIVHRDVSPQNILVGADGMSRLVDFGIAKAAGRLQEATNASAIKGKFGYMAPEQIRGEDVSRLTDTFSAAVVFWELLTGEALFSGRSDAEIVHKCLVARIRAPSMWVDGLPAQIDEILAKGLSRDLAQRYQTARAMALDIEASVPAIRPSEVAAWVERLAADTLATRATKIAEIERMERGEMATLSMPGPRSEKSFPAGAPAARAPVGDNPPPSDEAPPRPDGGRGSRRSLKWGARLLVLAFVGALLVVASRSRGLVTSSEGSANSPVAPLRSAPKAVSVAIQERARTEPPSAPTGARAIGSTQPQPSIVPDIPEGAASGVPPERTKLTDELIAWPGDRAPSTKRSAPAQSSNPVAPSRQVRPSAPTNCDQPFVLEPQTHFKHWKIDCL